MKKNHFLFFSCVLLSFYSCQKQEQKTRVVYKRAENIKTVFKKDTSQIQIADLPILIEGTNYLLHPVAHLRIYDKASIVKYDSSNSSDFSYSISNASKYEITGYLQNIKFQKIGSDSLKPLTNKPILIKTVTFLNTVFEKTGKQILVYTMADDDTNGDRKVDFNDITTLYLSKINGEALTKISNDLQELIDWKLIEFKNELYFRTIEDTNKNGLFDKDDVVHYNYIDLSKKDWKSTKYNPI